MLRANRSAARRRRFTDRNAQQLKRGFDLKAPCFQQRLRDVLRIPITTSPFPKTGGAQELVRGELEFLHNLLKSCDGGHDRADWLRLAPIWISTTLCHVVFDSPSVRLLSDCLPKIGKREDVWSESFLTNYSILRIFNPKINRRVGSTVVVPLPFVLKTGYLRQ